MFNTIVSKSKSCALGIDHQLQNDPSYIPFQQILLIDRLNMIYQRLYPDRTGFDHEGNKTKELFNPGGVCNALAHLYANYQLAEKDPAAFWQEISFLLQCTDDQLKELENPTENQRDAENVKHLRFLQGLILYQGNHEANESRHNAHRHLTNEAGLESLNTLSAVYLKEDLDALLNLDNPMSPLVDGGSYLLHWNDQTSRHVMFLQVDHGQIIWFDPNHGKITDLKLIKQKLASYFKEKPLQLSFNRVEAIIDRATDPTAYQSALLEQAVDAGIQEKKFAEARKSLRAKRVDSTYSSKVTTLEQSQIYNAEAGYVKDRPFQFKLMEQKIEEQGIQPLIAAIKDYHQQHPVGDSDVPPPWTVLEQGNIEKLAGELRYWGREKDLELKIAARMNPDYFFNTLADHPEKAFLVPTALAGYVEYQAWDKLLDQAIRHGELKMVELALNHQAQCPAEYQSSQAIWASLKDSVIQDKNNHPTPNFNDQRAEMATPAWSKLAEKSRAELAASFMPDDEELACRIHPELINDPVYQEKIKKDPKLLNAVLVGYMETQKWGALLETAKTYGSASQVLQALVHGKNIFSNKTVHETHIGLANRFAVLSNEEFRLSRELIEKLERKLQMLGKQLKDPKAHGINQELTSAKQKSLAVYIRQLEHALVSEKLVEFKAIVQQMKDDPSIRSNRSNKWDIFREKKSAEKLSDKISPKKSRLKNMFYLLTSNIIPKSSTLADVKKYEKSVNKISSKY